MLLDDPRCPLNKMVASITFIATVPVVPSVLHDETKMDEATSPKGVGLAV